MITTMTNDSYSTDSSLHIIDKTVGCEMTGLRMMELSSTRKVKFSCQATFMTLGLYDAIYSWMKPTSLSRLVVCNALLHLMVLLFS